MSPPRVLRAWLVGHDAREAAAAMVVVTVVLAAGSQWLLPVPGQARKVPFWQLTPALLAMLASLATVNRLPTEHGPAQRAARGAWACFVVATAAGCSWVVGAGANLPSLVPGTTAAVALTFAVASLAGRQSVWVGAVLALVVLSRVTRVAATEDLWAGLPATTQVTLAGGVVLGLARYCWTGAGRRDARH